MKVVSLPKDFDTSDLVAMLQEKFSACKRARQTQIDDNFTRWEKNYAGIPAQEIRTTPFNRASNFMPQLIRMHSDILSSRVLGIIFGTKPFWMVKSMLRDQSPHETFDALGEGINYLYNCDLQWFPTVDEIVNQSFQNGTLILKQMWSDETRSILVPGSDGSFEDLRDQSMKYYPVPFENFWPYPISAKNSNDAEICFERIRCTKRTVMARAKSGIWNQQAAEGMFPENRNSNATDAVYQDSGISLTIDVDYPYSAVEAWLDYEIGGQTRSIVVVFNPQVMGKESVLTAYYNPTPGGERPYVDFTPMPRKGSFFGYAVPEILEQSQEECAQIHNARRDANMIANVPGWKKKRYADVPNPATDWFPGCVLELEEMDDLEPLQFGGNYNSMIDEEQWIMSWAEKLIGVSPAMQGFGAGQTERGIYNTGGTMALLSEGNQRLDIFIRRLRYPFHRVANTTMQSYRSFNPGYFDSFGEKGGQILSALDAGYSGGKILFDISASEASSNREIDRQNLLQMANVIGPYYERIIQLTQLLTQVQPDNPIYQTGIMVLDGARDLANRLLFAFNVGDRNRIVPDVAGLLGRSAGTTAGAEPGGLPGDAATVQPSQLEDILQRTATASGGGAG